MAANKLKSKPRFRRLTEQERTGILYLIDHGLHGWKIAEVMKCSKGQVYTVGKAFGVSLLDYRNGKTIPAERVISRIPVVEKS